MIHTKLHHRPQCRRPDAKRVEGSKGINTWRCPSCGAVASTPKNV